MPKKVIRGIPAAALTFLAAAGYGLILPSPALAAHTCTHYVIVYCMNWESAGYPSAQECNDWEMANCPYGAVEPADPALAAKDGKSQRRTVTTAASSPSSAPIPPAAAPSLQLRAK